MALPHYRKRVGKKTMKDHDMEIADTVGKG